MHLVTKRAFWNYYTDLNKYNIFFSLILGLVFGFIWGAISLFSFGLIFGYYGFQVFQAKNYYFYFNLGITKGTLLKTVLLVNFFFSTILLLIYFIIKL